MNINKIFENLLCSLKEKNIPLFDKYYSLVVQNKVENILTIVYNSIVNSGMFCSYLQNSFNCKLLLKFYYNIRCFNTLKIFLLLTKINA